jgi:hypothetical protein
MSQTAVDSGGAEAQSRDDAKRAILAGLVALGRALETEFRLAERAGGRCVILAEVPLAPASSVILTEAVLRRPPFAHIPLETSVLHRARAALASYQPGAEIPIVAYANGPPRVVITAVVRRRAGAGAGAPGSST